jgi:hypothetical protein
VPHVDAFLQHELQEVRDLRLAKAIPTTVAGAPELKVKYAVDGGPKRFALVPAVASRRRPSSSGRPSSSAATSAA